MHALSQAGALPSVPGFCSGIATCTVVLTGAVTSLCPSGRHPHPTWQAGSALWIAQTPQTPLLKPTVPAIPEERH